MLSKPSKSLEMMMFTMNEKFVHRKSTETIQFMEKCLKTWWIIEQKKGKIDGKKIQNENEIKAMIFCFLMNRHLSFLLLNLSCCDVSLNDLNKKNRITSLNWFLVFVFHKMLQCIQIGAKFICLISSYFFHRILFNLTAFEVAQSW